MTPLARTQLVKSLARQVGFDLVGVARAGPVERIVYYREWLAAGHGGSMAYLSRAVESRADPRRLLPGARSIICVAVSYCRKSVTAPDAARPLGRVAAYARGRDYHLVLRDMLTTLGERLRERLQENFESRVCVDTAPILEREWASAAGLGWIGKNTCLINRHFGSYLVLGELVTTLELAPDAPVADRCARCTRCLEACPTDAFLGPYQLNAARCISYLTVEHRGDVPAEFCAAIGDRVFGCDICQEVCPYNRKAPLGTHPELVTDAMPPFLDLLELLRLRSGAYRRLTSGSAARRARRFMWRRNAAIALGNAAMALGNTGPVAAELQDDIRHALQAASRDDDSLLRQAVARVLRSISTRAVRRPRSLKTWDRLS